MKGILKRGWLAGLALAVCITSISAFAAASTNDENTKWTTNEVPMPTPTASQVEQFYWREQGDEDVRVYRSSSDIEKACGALQSLNKKARVEVNVSNIPKADMIFEMRMLNGDLMRYNIYSKQYYGHNDRIILERKEGGQHYQGMGFTEGNVTQVVNQLWDVANNSRGSETGMVPFTLQESDISSIQVFDFDALTYSPISSRDSIKYVTNLLRAANPKRLEANSSLGGILEDIDDIYINRKDGTRIICTLGAQGMILTQTPGVLDVEKTTWVSLDSSIYQKLLTALRERKGAPRPAWLGTMNVGRVTSATIMNVSGSKMQTLKAGDAKLDALLSELQNTAVKTNSLSKSTKPRGVDNSYRIRLEFDSDVAYTIDYGTSQIEISSSDISYSATYTLADKRPDGVLENALRG